MDYRGEHGRRGISRISITVILRQCVLWCVFVVLVASAFNHFINPHFYDKMIPSFLPPLLVNFAAGIVEALIAVLLVFPRYRSAGGLAFLLLMVAFLPIHLWDLIRDDPAVGSTVAAVLRFVMQYVLIYIGYVLWKTREESYGGKSSQDTARSLPL